MKAIYLVPSSFRKWAWLIFIPAILVGILSQTNVLDDGFTFLKGDPFWMDKSDGNRNFTDELVSICLVLSLWIIGFSKRKIEDERSAAIRQNALYWGITAYSIVLIIQIASVYGLLFFTAMVYNLFTPLLLFVLRLEWLFYQDNKQGNEE